MILDWFSGSKGGSSSWFWTDLEARKGVLAYDFGDLVARKGVLAHDFGLRLERGSKFMILDWFGCSKGVTQAGHVTPCAFLSNNNRKGGARDPLHICFDDFELFWGLESGSKLMIFHWLRKWGIQAHDLGIWPDSKGVLAYDFELIWTLERGS
jgi:hypothetical protein